MEIIGQKGGLFRPGNLMRFLGAWAAYIRIELTLSLYETQLSLRRLIGNFPGVSRMWHPRVKDDEKKEEVEVVEGVLEVGRGVLEQG